ncbi:AAA family ATPase [Sphingobacterium alkalisoli]|uniref:AAA family ATPase n=1 Tax=Sphingobacterium alkalisoli TaxID=1874115 RepID=A0A4U0GMV6_9SPHI|nr:AAA family ATPase [Sphingobacterium alkalisoli]TJY60078.1 AAA family ATPase [Sphingobacterium alkalisoli]GGH32754.1 ATPase AAA [Sphingobacterium alkalisoli]
MEALIELFQRKLRHVSVDFKRSLMQEVNWNARLIGIKGARGIGKTTLLLQHIKLHLSDRLDEVLYVSLDTIWFNTNSLVGLVKEFEQKGGKYIFLDEVHKYDGWAQELKNIYDDYPELKIVFTGSSLLEILNARADLSRRAVIYTMQGFSFREYLAIETGVRFERITLVDLLAQHTDKAREVNERIKPFQHFSNYLQQGYYPYYKEQPDLYFMRLGEVLNMMLEIELPLLRQIDLAYVAKIKQLLTIIAESVPFIPNVSKISEKIGINRSTLLSYLHYLDEIDLTTNLFKYGEGISLLQKPSKIYLENTNLVYLLAKENANRGNLRETFFANQVGYAHDLSYAEQGDFTVDNQYTFEIGGKDKTEKQIKGVDRAYVASDDITHGFHHKIPLWLFGFLY